ncbi:hypothetical protein AS9A_2189 [Hoyosella subflava DQS3-9A1]|uniref:Uncharacterized protein n=1 Tax=Hoyosella subflava (strain DSM 45089 / JCM 17490 / NBRC 109087 / DQS3-9A1) TaxID=443218 RepID=F6EQF3_HOYSD|nr:hypothetical protein AS9A_2189 [Hoyosella subflava DQS3-9A1]
MEHRIVKDDQVSMLDLRQVEHRDLRFASSVNDLGPVDAAN